MARDDILSKGAILQKDGETYAVTVRLRGSVFDVPTGRRIADAAEKYGAHTLKITGDARLAVIGIKEGDIDNFYSAIGSTTKASAALCQQYIKVCPGNTFCPRGLKDTLAFAGKLDEKFYPYPKITSKVKIGVAGCMNSCAEPAIKDIGLIGLPKGWVLMVGGAGGKEPMIAETIGRNLSDDEALDAVDKILKYYRGASMTPRTRNLRLGVILQKEGKDRLLRVLGLTAQGN
ncbi:MAG: NAD(P)/FAD-dependent oxidoreductase [Pseudomonadota bacterium]